MDVISPTYESPKILIPAEAILHEVKRIAQELRTDYFGRNPLIIGILKGSFIFIADLIRLMEIPVQVEFVRFSSYGSGKKSSGRIKTIQGLEASVADRDVIIVDDIADTGLSLNHFIKSIQRKKPASVKTCVLLDKPSCRKTGLTVDYVGITIPDTFVVGYGLDCNEEFRQLPHICCVEE